MLHRSYTDEHEEIAKFLLTLKLPWFVQVNKDIEIIEFEPIGTYEQLAKAHRTLTARPLSPSGYLNMYGGINIAFLGAVHLPVESLISKAIVCQLL